MPKAAAVLASIAPPVLRWLSNLSFTCLTLAIVLAWHAYSAARGRSAPLPEWQVQLEFAAAGVLFALFLIGVRERHRRLDRLRSGDRDEHRDPDRDPNG